MLPTRTARILTAALALSVGAVASGQAQPKVATPPVPAQAEVAPTPQTPKTEPAPPAQSKKTAEEKTVVTGSHVRRKDPKAPARTTVYTREQLEMSGRPLTGDALKNTPGTPK
jgi:glucose/arabinose dehydrogenase